MARECNVSSYLLYGRYWIRTSDPFRVKEVRYRCANRPMVCPSGWDLVHITPQPGVPSSTGPVR